jgi:electron transfer flavoprotein beta subunit
LGRGSPSNWDIHVKTIVCVKRIGDLPHLQDGGAVELSAAGQAPNPLDFSALEEALQVRTAEGGDVTALSVGPQPAEATLKKALMMGVDRIVRLWDERLRGCDSFGMALVLAKAAQAIGFDLLMCGARSADTGSELVAAAIAEHLGLPLIARAIALRIDRATGRVIADKKLERGAGETYAARLPAVLAIERGPTEPRYSNPLWVRRLIRSKVDLLTLKDIGLALPLPAPRVSPLGLTAPKRRTKIGVRVSGLSLKDKLAIMRGRAGAAKKKEEVVEERPEDAARKIKEHLERWLG